MHIVVCVRIARGSVSNSPESGIGTETNTLTITISFRISIKYFHQIIISMKCRRLVLTVLSWEPNDAMQETKLPITLITKRDKISLYRTNMDLNVVDQLLAKRSSQYYGTKATTTLCYCTIMLCLRRHTIACSILCN